MEPSFTHRTTLLPVATTAADLAQFVQRRELLSHETRLARVAYAYGVDLRRSGWLDRSTFGEPLMRAVDRRWSRFTGTLMADELQPIDQPAPTAVMEELLRIIELLRAPRPTLRLLRGGADPRRWPIATPIGTTQGGTHWLILDTDRLSTLKDHERTFVLASALAHLQCDHGALFAAHLMSHREHRRAWAVRVALRAWVRVATFSSDRAALVAIGNADLCMEAMQLQGDPQVPWWPQPPTWPQRVHNLEDFDKSRVMVRLKLMRSGALGNARAGLADPSLAPNRSAEGPRTDEAEVSGPSSASSTSVRMNGSANETESTDSVADAEAQAEQIVREREASEGTGETKQATQDRAAEQEKIEEALNRAWPLARCDERLTRRLGIL